MFQQVILLPTGCARSMWPDGNKIAYVFCICWFVVLCVPTYHVHNNYITYVLATQFYFSVTSDGWVGYWRSYNE